MIGAGSLRFPIYTSFPKTLAETSRPQHHLATAMKDRPPPSSYGAVYVPPHHRLRSVITTSSNNLSSSAISVSDSNSKSVATQQNKSSSNLRPNPYPYLPPHQQQKRNSQSDWADELSEEGSDRDIEPSSYPGASTTDNLDGWKWKLTTLLRSKDKQELVSRDKKDRRDFEQIAALASKVGLYSHLYVKVVVVSKVPLPNYRFDLDDKRPQREVILPPGLQRRVDCHLGDHLSRKSGSVESFRDNAFSRSSSSCSIATDEGLFEQPEPLPESKAAMEKIIWRRSMQMRSQQQTWQRRGRAGRVQPGECYHLYPRCVYNAFADYQLPEILRTPLQSLCLQIKSLKLGSISEFLSRALQSPELLAVQNAIEYLKIIAALDENENLTVLGRYLTMLPMEPKLGKMLIAGAIFNCLDPILTIVAGLSVRDPFLTPLDKKDLAEAAKAQFSRDYSDHLALVRAYEGWTDAERDLSGYEYCWKNFLSAQSMKAIDALRRELYSLLKDTGLVDSNMSTCNSWSYDENLLRAVICYGLYPGICSVVHNEKSFFLKTMEDGQVLLYSNSVNAREPRIPYPWLVFNEKIKVNSIFLRDSTAISDSMLLLFGGNISRGDADGHLKMLGGYLEFFMKPDVAELYQSLRKELEELIENKLLNPRMALMHQDLMVAVRMLLSDNRCDGRFVFNRQVLQPSKPSITATPPALLSRTESGPGGDNSKSQLQTLLTRAGYAAPTYKTTQLKNNQFQATVDFNGMQIVGRPCNNKKQAEKDAAAEALQWLMGGSHRGHDYVEQMSIFLKKSKRDHR